MSTVQVPLLCFKICYLLKLLKDSLFKENLKIKDVKSDLLWLNCPHDWLPPPEKVKEGEGGDAPPNVLGEVSKPLLPLWCPFTRTSPLRPAPEKNSTEKLFLYLEDDSYQISNKSGHSLYLNTVFQTILALALNTIFLKNGIISNKRGSET